ncbi:MAG: HAMP domain-containing sensor histidine kinase [Oscillospiraceae bacterium]|nr:HAMP domain-containing sensor histidine kinase [Oscillospiraceae bacterium]
MIKKLQRRFIIISVCAVSAVLFVIMSGICVSNYTEIIADADSTLEMLTENNGNYPKFDKNIKDGDFGTGSRPGQTMSPEAPFETRFFVAYLDESGEVSSVNTGSIAAVATDEAIEYAEKVVRSGRQNGFVGVYRYSVSKSGSGSLVVFLDCSRGLNLFQRFFETSLAVSLIGIFGVFVIVLLMSKRAIKPIADSYEKQKHFITDASHELKTPLTVINASTEVLEMTQGESEWTQSIRNQVARLTELTNSLVSLARMDEHDNRLIMTDFSLSDAVTESLDSFSILARQQGKTFRTNIRKNVSYEGNEEEIRRLVVVLADNAVKYSGEKGEITVTLKTGPKGPLLLVTNTVDEIKKGSHDELFERFYRGDPSHNSEIGGFGIGLSIARAIVSAHKGKISARSEDGKSLAISVQL